MLSGKPAFTGASIPEVVFKVVYEQPAPLQGVAPELVAAIMQAMAKAPEQRFASVGAFVQAFTGQPLSQFKAPVPTLLEHGKGPASSGSGKRHTGVEAFANTMGSDSSPPSPPEATRSMRAPSEPVPPNQPTVESLPPKPPIAVPEKRSRAWIGIAAVVGLAVCGVVGYVVVNRDEPPPPPPTPPPVIAAAPVPVPVIDAAAPVVPAAAIAVVHDAPSPDAAVPAKKPPPTPKPPTPTPTPKPPEDKDEDTKPEVKDKIAEARKAIQQGEFGKAQKIV